MVVGMLAILKAGGAYVPLHPSYPSMRLMQNSGGCVAKDRAQRFLRTKALDAKALERRTTVDLDEANRSGRSNRPPILTRKRWAQFTSSRLRCLYLRLYRHTQGHDELFAMWWCRRSGGSLGPAPRKVAVSATGPKAEMAVGD
jgi:hypothetical protein